MKTILVIFEWTPGRILNLQLVVEKWMKELWFWKVLTFILATFRWEIKFNNSICTSEGKSTYIPFKRLLACDRKDCFYGPNFLWLFNMQLWSKTKSTNGSHRACLFTSLKKEFISSNFTLVHPHILATRWHFLPFPSDECQSFSPAGMLTVKAALPVFVIWTHEVVFHSRLLRQLQFWSSH